MPNPQRPSPDQEGEHTTQGIHEAFSTVASAHPHRIALSYEGSTLTYDELDRKANRIAHGLIRAGTQVGDKVGICAGRSAGLVAAILGTLKAGACYVPLDPDYPASRLSFLLTDSAPGVVLVDEEAANTLPEGERTIHLDLGSVLSDDGLPDTDPGTPVEPSTLAYVIYTSGSTGTPKGVQVTHQNVLRLFTSTAALFRFSPDDVWTLFHSYAFDFSVWEIWGALLFGGRLVVVPHLTSRSPRDFRDLLKREGVTVLNQTPSAFLQLQGVEMEEADRLPLRYVIFGGEALRFASLGPWVGKYGDDSPFLINMYGITETTVHVTYRKVEEQDVTSDPGSLIGGPLPDLDLHIIGPSGQIAPAGEAGELYVGGAGVTAGYLGRPDLTAQRFVRNPFGPGTLYRTGDKVRETDDGDFEYLGRLDDQVQLRGFRIELGEVAAGLTRHEAVLEAVAMLREDRVGDPRLVGYFVPAGDSQPSLDDVLAEARKYLPEYMVPNHLVQMDSLPLTAHGKVDRDALPAPDHSPRAERTPSLDDDVESPVPGIPGEDLESFLVGVWQKVLGSPALGPESDFFLEGGHSLLATQAMGLVEKEIDLKIPFRFIFQHSTPAGLAVALKDWLAEILGVEPPIRTRSDRPSVEELAEKVLELAPSSGPETAHLPKASREGPLPLSFSQQRMWFIEQVEEETNLYNIPLTLELRGSLDRDALYRSVEAIVARHEALRTRLIDEDGVPFQAIVEPTAEGAWEWKDVEWDAAADLIGYLEAEAARPFDLARGPLFRAGLYRRGVDDHVLQVVMHHTVSDGWSVGIFRRELSALYRSFKEGKASPLPPLEYQYADYAAWQQDWLQGDVLENQLGYWRDKLAELTHLDLPTDRPRPPEQSFRGANHDFQIPHDLAEGLGEVGRSEGSTLFMTLMAAFNVLLHRYSGQPDIAVGTPIAGRNRNQLQELMGMFVNTLVIRSDLSGEMSFRELLRQIRDTSLEAQTHQELPFEKLVEELQPKRDLSRNPLFQVMFALQNMPDIDLVLPDLDIRNLDMGDTAAEFDLALFVWEPEEEGAKEERGFLEGRWSFATDLFDETTIERMQGHFLTLLEGITADPDALIGDLALMPDSERRILLEEWSRGPELPAPGDLCLHHLFEARARENPDRVAVVAEDGEMTYGELESRANRLARRLADLGVGPEVLVGVSLPRSAEMVVALLGVLKAGGAYLPVDPDLPVERLSYMMEDSQARVLITDSMGLESFPSFDGGLVCLDTDDGKLEGVSDVPLPATAGPDHLAYVIYTSGSTGRPKGVEVLHRNVVGFLQSITEWPGFGADDVVMAVATLSFDASVEEIFGSLGVGARLVLAPADTVMDGDELQILLKESGATFLDCTPAVWRSLFETGWDGDKAMRGWAGGEALPLDLARSMEQSLGEAWNTYGPTEATVGSTSWRIPSDPSQIRLGSPNGNYANYVLDDRMQPVPAGVPGELYIGGIGVTRGYRNRPELTAERFVPDPFGWGFSDRLYKTGDRVRFREDGTLEFLGRLDDQVKIRGLRIELGEIEAALRGNDVVRQAAVLVHGQGADARLAAYVVFEPGQDLTSTELRRFLRRSLPDYMVPGLFIELDELPLTPSGKLDRGSLPDPLSGAVAGTREYHPPNTPEEILIGEIWQDLLELDHVSRTDNFFEIGGHSLLSIRAVSLIEKRSGQKLDPRAMFFQTLEQLAATMTVADTSSP